VIDVDAPFSPGWWLDRLSKRLNDRGRQRRLQGLADRMDGRPPLPVGAPNARKAFEAFQRKACSNFAELIVEAARERIRPIGIRTSVDGDETGDAEAWRIWRRAGMTVVTADTLDFMLGLSEGYMIVGPPDEDDPTVPVVTAEDPRQVITENDPAKPHKVLAALKMFHDDVAESDVAYLLLPRDVGRGRESATLFVASREARQLSGWRMAFNSQTWSWDESRRGLDGEALAVPQVPVVRFLNKRGLGEFETHTDILDRINHTILDRMVISTMQAFRQRAIKGLPMVYPAGHAKAGQEIDYEGLFVSDPAAFWQLPDTADIWESGTLDLTPVLSSIKDDVQHLGAVSRTPMYMLQPAGENQSAEGASLAREGLTFKTEDRIDRADTPLSVVLSLCFQYLGDVARADRDKLQVIWAPVERLSLMERADAWSKTAEMPFRTRLVKVFGMAPHEADQVVAEQTADLARVAAFAPRPVAAVPAPPQQAAQPPAQQPRASGAVA
jgi:hypothetical protein